MFRRRARGILALLVMAASMGLVGKPIECWAGSGTLIRLPFPGTKNRSGILADVDTRWVDGSGYRPVTITLRAPRARADRTIRVVVMPNSWNQHYVPLAISTDVEIPQGSGSVRETIYVPQHEQWHQLRVEFYEEGRLLEDISMENSAGWNVSYWSRDDGVPTLLMVDDDAPTLSNRQLFVAELKAQRGEAADDTFLLPDARKFGYILPNHRAPLQQNAAGGPIVRRATNLDSLEFVDQAPNIELIPPSDLPPQHIGLAGVDLIIIPWPDLQKLASQDAERFTALKRHIQRGGNLVVHGETDVFSETAALMGMRSASWERPDPGMYAAAQRNWQTAGYADGMALRSRRLKKEELAKMPTFQVTSLGMGRVAAIQSDDPYELEIAYWQYVLNAVGYDRISWVRRHGVSLIQNNKDYWDFMIPGFGAAPVKSFLATISAFIILIGPVNFYLLKRAKRLYLLPLTVGGASMVTTVAMLCYAVLNDGISTRVRLRSFTQLDQAEGLAATHCRHAYLAAFAPSDGLTFPSRTCVYPIVAFQAGMRRREIQNDRLEIRQLTDGYIRSRSTAQFLTTDVRATDARLTVNSTQDGVVVINQLGTTLVHLWIWSGRGELTFAHEISPGTRCELTRVDAKSAQKDLNAILQFHRPQPPPGLDKGVDRTMFGMLGWQGSGGSTPVRFAAGQLEKNIAATRGFFTQPVPQTYLAIACQAPPFISTGTKAIEEAGFHVIRGTWDEP